MAKKAKNVGAWIFWAIVVIVAGIVLWQYIAQNTSGSQAATGGGTVYVSRDAASPLSYIAIGGRLKQGDSVWRFAYSSGEEGVTGRRASLIAVAFTVKNAPKVVQKAYIRKYNAASTSPLLATASIVGDRVAFTFKNPIIIKDGAALSLELLFDLMKIGGTTQEDTPFVTRIARSSDVSAITTDGATLQRVRVVLGVDEWRTNYLFSTKPAFSVAGTPSGALTPSSDTLIFKLKVTADASGDVTWTTKSSSHGRANGMEFLLKFQLNDFSGYGHTSFRIVDMATGKQLWEDSMRGLGTGGVEDRTHIGGGFDADFPVAAGTTRQIGVYMDTREFEDVGDWLQVVLLPEESSIDWGIDGIGNYLHGDILARGGLYGGRLEKV